MKKRLSTTESPKTYALSPTSLSVMDRCGQCFWLAQNEKIAQPRGLFPSLPSGMDEIFKNEYERCAKIDPTGATLPGSLASLQGKARLFTDLETLRGWQNFRKGLRTTSDIGDVLYGAPDAILVEDGALVVMDYKTRMNTVREAPSYNAPQLEIYTHLLRENGHNVASHAYLQVWSPSAVEGSDLIRFNAQLFHVDINPDNAAALFDKATTLLRGPKPAPSTSCEYCSYATKRSMQP